MIVLRLELIIVSVSHDLAINPAVLIDCHISTRPAVTFQTAQHHCPFMHQYQIILLGDDSHVCEQLISIM